MTFGTALAKHLNEAARERRLLGHVLKWEDCAPIIDNFYRQHAAANRRPHHPEVTNGVIDPLFAAMCAFEGVDSSAMTAAHKRTVAIALGQICKASPEVTPAEIARRGVRYLVLFRGITPTAMGMAASWARCYVNGSAASKPPAPLPEAAERTPNFGYFGESGEVRL